jgi:antitoxin (DNA-binding transcriptional repressor) of toxin-antitoxin stability system
MDTYGVVEAQKRLSELVDRAVQGEAVVIPVAELRAIPTEAGAITPADLDWLAERRVGKKPTRENAGTFVSTMRDEGADLLTYDEKMATCARMLGLSVLPG